MNISEIPIPEGVFYIVEKQLHINKELALAWFARELAYQCRVDYDSADLIYAVIASDHSPVYHEFDKKYLIELGYNEGTLFWSSLPEGHPYRNPEGRCDGGTTRYLRTLYDIAKRPNIHASVLDRSAVGLAFLHLLFEYKSRVSYRTSIPCNTEKMLIKDYGAVNDNGILTFSCKDNLPDGILWYQHEIYEDASICKTIVKLEAGVWKEVVGDYYKELWVEKNVKKHLVAAILPDEYFELQVHTLG